MASVSEFFARATGHRLTPTIINPNSNFVVITYWWGRGIPNKNTQRPCPEDAMDGQELEVQPIRYEEMIENWKTSCKNQNCNFLAEEYPEFAVKGGYQHAINFKPYFIDLALEACSPRGVLYIDGDMKIKMYPGVCDMKDVDYMARGWNSDPRPSMASKKPSFCFDPYVFETSGGTMFFGNTFHGRRLLKVWQRETAKHPGKADDRILSMAIMLQRMLLSLSIVQLPIEYLWLDLHYDTFLRPKKDYQEKYVAITHPECLTGEDRASKDGAAANRYPRNYDRYVTKWIFCDWEEVYEFLQFEDKSQTIPFQPYFNFLEEHGVVDYYPFSSKYGPYNDIVKKNTKLLQKINLLVKDNLVLVTPHDFQSPAVHKVSGEHETILTILKYILNGQQVLYAPSKSSRTFKNVLNHANSEELDFVARNKNKKRFRAQIEYSLDLETSYPMYFGPKNKVLKQMLLMAQSFKDINKLFGRTYIFLTRIHCGWV